MNDEQKIKMNFQAEGQGKKKTRKRVWGRVQKNQKIKDRMKIKRILNVCPRERVQKGREESCGMRRGTTEYRSSCDVTQIDK